MPHHKKDSETEGPIIYLIRHGEKPPKINDKDQDGLSAQGLARASGLVKVFDKDSLFDIGYILAQHPEKGKGISNSPFITSFNQVLYEKLKLLAIPRWRRSTTLPNRQATGRVTWYRDRYLC